MAGCRAPMLLVDVSPWLVPVSFRLVLLSFLVAGDVSPWLVVPPGILDRIFTAGHPRAGVQPDSSARRRNHLNGSLSGFFLIGYSSICQLFKFSYRLLHAKVFTGENFIKTLFSINYRGYFIIQATHSTIIIRIFLHKTDRKHVENQ